MQGRGTSPGLARPGYRGLRWRGEGWAPFARGAGPACPSDLPVCEGKEAAGRAGEDSSHVSNLLLRDSPGTAPGKARSLCFLSSLLDSGTSAPIPGAGAGGPPRAPYTLSPDGLSSQETRQGSGGPGSEGCRDSGGAGAHLDRLPSQEAPGRAAELRRTWRYLPRAGHALSKSREGNPAALLQNCE